MPEAAAAAAAAAAPAASEDPLLDGASEQVRAMDIEEKKDGAAAAASPAEAEAGPEEEEEEDLASDGAGGSTGGSTGASSSSSSSSISPIPPASAADLASALCEALCSKEEGNQAFGSGDLDGAARAYRVGTSLLKPHHRKDCSEEEEGKEEEKDRRQDEVRSLLLVLQTNLSMVMYRRGEITVARDAASGALEIDPDHVKARYRRALARRRLGDVTGCREDLRAALRTDPANRSVRAELASLRREAGEARRIEQERLSRAFSSGGGKGSKSFLYGDREEEEERKERERVEREEAKAADLKRRQGEWGDECVRRMDANEEPVTFDEWDKARREREEEEEKARKKARKEKEDARRAAREAERRAARGGGGGGGGGKGSDGDDGSDGDELTEKELAEMRGYKKTADGRTTSYFNREISEEERAMLQQASGPRLMQPSEEAPRLLPSASPSSSTSASASAWNQAGTWEEKDTSEWCRKCLKGKVRKAAAAASPSSGYSVRVTKVKDLGGDASVVLTRGKKRYVFDYHLSAQFDVKCATGGVGAGEIDEDEADEATGTTEEVVATGTLKLPDVSSTATIEELEVVLSPGWERAPSAAHAEGVAECRGLLVEQVREQVRAFVTEFNAQY